VGSPDFCERGFVWTNNAEGQDLGPTLGGCSPLLLATSWPHCRELHAAHGRGNGSHARLLLGKKLGVEAFGHSQKTRGVPRDQLSRQCGKEPRKETLDMRFCGPRMADAKFGNFVRRQ
jgi:hypothetical protein